jgi:hypothetical protein
MVSSLFKVSMFCDILEVLFAHHQASINSFTVNATIKESEECFSDLKIRDVPMDDRMTINWWSKKNVTGSSNKNSINIVECKETTVEPKSSSWDFTEKKCISK